MPGALYARFVPPKATPKPQVSLNTPTTPSHTTRPSNTSPEARQRRKESQDGKAKKRHDEAGLKSQPAELPVPEQRKGAEPVSEEARKSIKKPKKRKREASIDDDTRTEEVKATPKKHKSILSKFERVSRRAQAGAKEESKPAEGSEVDVGKTEPEVLHDLEPLPQPAPVPDPEFKPTFSVLPTWLAHPINIEASKKVPFNELGVHPFFSKKLEKQGYTEALAVQSALLPMLHPGYEQHLGDICVSAKTGSGKTLAYLLPVVEALKECATTVLSAIVVVPSRQLVDQAMKVAEELCTGTKIKVGAAVGSVPFATEQKQLIKLRPQYDPKTAKELHERAARQLETGFIERGGIFEDLMSMPTDHVPRYDSNVHILICTPGRLVEHIESTTGFLLRSVRWLVIDEADQLLKQDFQGWAAVLMNALHSETPDDFMDMQERLRKEWRSSAWTAPVSARTLITKVVLSATMEKDLTKLGLLRLKRPKLIVVQDEADEQNPVANDDDVFELPSTLDEFAVPVGSGQRKPLYLLYFLLNEAFKNPKTMGKQPDPEFSDSSSDSGTEEESQPGTTTSPLIAEHQSRVLIFTKSNESASRLSHLLSVLEAPLKKYLRTMSPSATAKSSKKMLNAFSSGSIKILIASDAASRGLDIPDITHVVNYDMPTSVTSYVHRVGRTARAGKAGEAWTLFTKAEAAWFWNRLARGESIRRGGKKVKRVEYSQWNVTFNRKRTYEAALAELQGAVEGAETAG